MESTVLLSYSNRDIEKRRAMSTVERFNSQTESHRVFGYDYFDNPAGMGYGGYYYDGRYADEVKKIVDFYQLQAHSRICEIGCAKGFLLVEFYKLGFEVTGIDLSKYCVDNAHELIKSNIFYGNAADFEFPDNHFDLIICKEMLPHVTLDEAEKILRQMNKWTKNSLLIIQCISDTKYADSFLYWDATHKIALTKDEWITFLENSGFCGQYNLKEII